LSPLSRQRPLSKTALAPFVTASAGAS
jgi:hypothetical protein